MECKGQTEGVQGQKRVTGRDDMAMWQTEATEDITPRSDPHERVLPPHTARPILDIGLHHRRL